ncbi:hypothetical protein BZA05DRAFT_397450 [Tricharina praecox]|uniref:uncharacterized protein n=1 Tax=Tricharina praecox TaxID=43433 RepID=UPI0022205366|nr:uncharacterized protein BZA05DRAFT_397450 [Tricharina praecox]KAI5852291.1 hypothetical protein BZA05DRAFT_397450 [Tricharina praecox]
MYNTLYCAYRPAQVRKKGKKKKGTLDKDTVACACGLVLPSPVWPLVGRVPTSYLCGGVPRKGTVLSYPVLSCPEAVGFRLSLLLLLGGPRGHCDFWLLVRGRRRAAARAHQMEERGAGGGGAKSCTCRILLRGAAAGAGKCVGAGASLPVRVCGAIRYGGCLCPIPECAGVRVRAVDMRVKEQMEQVAHRGTGGGCGCSKSDNTDVVVVSLADKRQACFPRHGRLGLGWAGFRFGSGLLE